MKFCMACGAPIESTFDDEKFCNACRFADDKEYRHEVRRRFGERLKAARERAGLSRKELGDAINISPAGFAYYERGQRDVTPTSLIRIARTLNVSADWLIGLDGEHEPRI